MSDFDRLDQARAAIERGDWQVAVDLLAAAIPEAVAAEGLELRAQAA